LPPKSPWDGKTPPHLPEFQKIIVIFSIAKADFEAFSEQCLVFRRQSAYLYIIRLTRGAFTKWPADVSLPRRNPRETDDAIDCSIAKFIT
jgi:hypothetical protein